ncbi:MAG: outer membrane beta-barrel protein [Roseiarcus sp.]|jgi:outer membrane immunogenic protein
MLTKAAVSCAALSAFVVPALAADMTTPKAAPPAPPSWTGLYGGVEGGAIWGRSAVTEVPPAVLAPTSVTNPFDVNGGLVGGTIGYNYRINNIVVGVEGDLSWARAEGYGTDIPPFNTSFSHELTQQSLATYRGRAGFALDPVFFYVTGGGAAAGVAQRAFDAPTPCGGAGCVGISQSRIMSGWTVGAGLEWSFLPSWSLKAEYLHVDLGRATYFAPPPNPTFAADMRVNMREDIMRVGLNYEFGWPPAPGETRR